MSTQQEELTRVRSKTQDAILGFIQNRSRFTADELRQAVAAVAPKTAPSSADRVMRDLRAQGLISVTCVNRSASLYRNDKFNLRNEKFKL